MNKLAIFVTSPVTPFSVGTTEDTETSVQTFTVPSAAREIVSIRGHIVAEAPSAAEGLACKFSLAGQDFRNRPYNFLSEIGGNHLGSIGGSPYAVQPHFFRANLPCQPGSTIGVSATPLTSLTGNGEALIDVVWSTKPTGLRPVQRLASSATASSTASGGSITVVDAHKIVDLCYAYIPDGVLVADEEVTSRLTLNSGALEEIQQLSLGNAVHGIEATSGISWTNLMRCNVDILVRDNPCVFTSSLALQSSSTNADRYLYSVGYEVK